MNLSFKYVDKPEARCVLLHLFTAADGSSQGDVSGPRPDIYSAGFPGVTILRQCASLDDAFAAGIRMANRNDTDLVISGNADLWRSKWGQLDRSTPRH